MTKLNNRMTERGRKDTLLYIIYQLRLILDECQHYKLAAKRIKLSRNIFGRSLETIKIRLAPKNTGDSGGHCHKSVNSPIHT